MSISNDMKKEKKIILVLGATGMLGNVVFRYLSSKKSHLVYGSVRSATSKLLFKKNLRKNLISNIDVNCDKEIDNLFSLIKPDIVINCIGIIKQLDQSSNVLEVVPINSLLPHRLALLCKKKSIRLIHFSTDCVFSGEKGNYTESDNPDAKDLYGRSKLIGEIDYSNCLTLRTSIIGPELINSRSLLCWFLKQSGTIEGFIKAIFSGLPTIEIARILHQYIIESNLSGIYHLSGNAIDKYSLLNLIAKIYNHKVKIVPSTRIVIDRSLNCEKFKNITGYEPKSWEDLVKSMREFN